MVSPRRDETHFVRCLKCGKILKCSRYDTATLLQHIRTDHPEIEVVETPPVPLPTLNPMKSQNNVQADGAGDVASISLPPEKPTEPVKRPTPPASCDVTLPQTSPPRGNPDSSDCILCDDVNSSESRNRKASMKCNPASAATPVFVPGGTQQQRSQYRYAIRKWKCGNGSLFCPQCGTRGKPVIRTRSERRKNNACNTACILCWPFCFLPFMYNNSVPKEYLFCPKCNTFLGLYDRSQHCIRPNRKYVESDECMRINAVDDLVQYGKG